MTREKAILMGGEGMDKGLGGRQVHLTGCDGVDRGPAGGGGM